jgi:hypothetical protein
MRAKLVSLKAYPSRRMKEVVYPLPRNWSKPNEPKRSVASCWMQVPSCYMSIQA